MEALSVKMILMDEGHANDVQVHPLLPCFKTGFSLEQIDSRHICLWPGIASVPETITPLVGNLQWIGTDSLERH